MVIEILKFVFICLEVLLLFNLLIVVHELGHFLAARWRGLYVDKFAIWFGKPLWKKTIGGVEYRLGSIPAGGFVSLPQMAPMEAMEGKVDPKIADLPPVKPIDKILVAVAGPAFSFGLACVFAVIVWVIGKPVGEGDATQVVGYVIPDGPAAKAGLLPGDKILKVNGHPVSRFAPLGNAAESIVWNIAKSESPVIPITFERDGSVRTVDVEPITPERRGIGRRNLKQILILPAQTPRIARIVPNSPAAEAGLRPQDLVLSANGQPLRSLPALAEILNTTGTAPVTLKVERGGQAFDVTVTPRIPVGGDKPRVGIEWDERGVTSIAHPTPWSQITGSVATMVDTVSAIMSRGSGISLQHLSGPVGIMRVYYLLFESPDGWRLALWFSVVLNVNLALLNLLPLPVLDGGHIVMSIVEMIRRKPIGFRVQEIVTNGFALLVIGFMLYVTFFDVLDLPGWRKREPDTEMTFSPTPAPEATP